MVHDQSEGVLVHVPHPRLVEDLLDEVVDERVAQEGVQNGRRVLVNGTEATISALASSMTVR